MVSIPGNTPAVSDSPQKMDIDEKNFGCADKGYSELANSPLLSTKMSPPSYEMTRYLLLPLETGQKTIFFSIINRL